MILGALIVEPPGAAQTVTATMVRAALHYEHESAKAVLDAPIFSLYRIRRNDVYDDEHQFIEVVTDDNSMAWLSFMGGQLTGDRSKLTRALSTHDWEHPLKLPGQWVAIKWSSSRRTLRIATDRLGTAWLYIAKVAGGIVFASDFGAVAAACSGRLTIDHDTVLMECVAGYSPDNRTIFKEISLAPPGAMIDCNADGWEVISTRPWEFGNRHAAWSDKRKFQELDRLYGSIAENQFLGNAESIVLSLSAGLDSRYALGLLDQHKLKCPLLTFGMSGSQEVAGARAVAARVGQVPELFTFTDARWDVWKRTMGILGNSGMVQWMGWSDDWMACIRANGSAVIIGYLGDALSGKHLGKQPHGVADWVAHWINWSVDATQLGAPIRAECVERIQEIMHRRFEEASKAVTVAFPFQIAMYLDLYGRQRRWVASQPNLLSRFAMPVTFFCDDPLIDFWTNLPLSDLVGQRLYLAYAADRFPKLFPSDNAVRNLIARIRRRLDRMRRDALRGEPAKPNPPVIDNQSIIAQNTENIISLAELVAPDFDAIIDMNAFIDMVHAFGRSGAEKQFHSQRIIRITNLLLLGALGRPREGA